MDQALAELIEISHTLGQDRRLTQGGGGNSSVKTADGDMYLKASGAAMKNMAARRGWRRLDLAAVLAILEDGSLAQREMKAREKAIADALLTCCGDQVNPAARPSIEAHFHALFDRCTIHLHPTAVNPYICSRGGREALAALFADDALPPLWAPYADLGYQSARQLQRLVGRYRRQYGATPPAAFLQKHGLIVTAPTPAKLLQRVRRIIRVCEKALGPRPAAKPLRADAAAVQRVQSAIKAVYQEMSLPIPAVGYCADKAVAAFLRHPDAARLLRIAPLLPHEVSYANGMPLWLASGEPAELRTRLSRHLGKKPHPPTSYLAAGLGLFTATAAAQAETVRDVLLSSLETRLHLDQFGGANPLNARQRRFLDEVYTYKPTEA